jgi:hypothetical protein
MSEADDLGAAVAALAARVRALEDQVEIMQLVAQYGPAADSGSGDAAAALWTEDGTFDVAGHFEMRGRDAIAGMVHGEGHQGLIRNGCGHVLTVPHIAVDGDGAAGRGYALNIRWDADGLALPGEVAREALDHLADGPAWSYGRPDPTAGSPLGALRRRAAVLALSNHVPGAAR